MVADGNGILNIEGGLGVVQHISQDGGDEEFPASHFASEAEARQAFFDPSFEVGEAIEGACIMGQLQGATLMKTVSA